MKKTVLLLALAIILVLAISIFGCSSGSSTTASDAIESKDNANEMAPKVSARTIQLAVTALMMAAGVGQLDAAYDEINTKEEIESVTAGNGAYNLSKYLDISSFDLLPAFDVALDGKVTID